MKNRASSYVFLIIEFMGRILSRFLFMFRDHHRLRLGLAFNSSTTTLYNSSVNAILISCGYSVFDYILYLIELDL